MRYPPVGLLKLIPERLVVPPVLLLLAPAFLPRDVVADPLSAGVLFELLTPQRRSIEWPPPPGLVVTSVLQCHCLYFLPLFCWLRWNFPGFLQGPLSPPPPSMGWLSESAAGNIGSGLGGLFPGYSKIFLCSFLSILLNFPYSCHLASLLPVPLLVLPPLPSSC